MKAEFLEQVRKRREESKTEHKCTCGEYLYKSNTVVLDATFLYCLVCNKEYTYWWRSKELTEGR